jgi:hypothetical protein
MSMPKYIFDLERNRAGNAGLDSEAQKPAIISRVDSDNRPVIARAQTQSWLELIRSLCGYER